MLTALFHIAKNTFRENLREPIYLLVLLVAMVLIGLFPAFTLFVFREQIKLVTDSAMATMLSFGWILAVLSATHAIAEEIQTGTANMLLAKPVTRPVFIVGKALGILGGLTVFCILTGLASLIALRVAKDQFYFDQKGLAAYFGMIALSCIAGGVHNFVKRSSFPMATVLAMLMLFPLGALAIRFIPVDDALTGYSWRIIPALVLVSYSVLIMGILATALSTRMDMVPNLIVCSVIFILGLVSDYVLGRYAGDNLLATILYAAIPNWQLFWMADALAAGKTIPLAYVLYATVYVISFSGFFLFLAVLLFRDREVGKQTMV